MRPAQTHLPMPICPYPIPVSFSTQPTGSPKVTGTTQTRTRPRPKQNPEDSNFDDLFEDDGLEDIAEGNPLSDEDWQSATDEDILDDNLSTCYACTRPPVIVFRPDGSVIHSVEAPQSESQTIASRSATSQPDSSSHSPTTPLPHPTLVVLLPVLHLLCLEMHSVPQYRSLLLSYRLQLRRPLFRTPSRPPILLHTPSHVRFAAYERAVCAQAEQIRHLTAELESATAHASMAALEMGGPAVQAQS